MTKETQNRIQAFIDCLPNMRQRVIAAALMLAIALSMIVSATFAWVTVSSAPEVSSIHTTVTANGSLEIALAGSDRAPVGSARGDSSATDNNVVRANNTWGNLINLSDPSYGLSKITLRPAALNGTTGLLTNPLYGVAYGEDGRVIKTTTDDDFAFCYYDLGGGDVSAAFLVDENSTHYGVRAISTVQYQNLTGDSSLRDLRQKVQDNQNTAKTNYFTMTDQSRQPGEGYVNSLQGLMQVYAQSQISGNLATLEVTEYVADLYEMMAYLRDKVMEPTGKAYLELANMCELIDGSGNISCGESLDSLCLKARNNTLPAHINIPGLKEFAQDYYNLKVYTDENPTAANQKKSLYYWKNYAEGAPVYWRDVQGIINWVVNIGTCTLNGYKMSELRSHITAVAGGGTKEAKIYDGALWRTEQRLGQKMNVSVTVRVTNVPIIGSTSVNAQVTTTATDPWTLQTDLDTVLSRSDGSFKGTDAVAEDTYAMAIDLWIRTNAGSILPTQTETSTETDADGNETTTTVITVPGQSFLTLEGHVITEERDVPAMMKDANGEDQEAYVAQGGGISYDVFLRRGTYYFLDEVDGETVEIDVESYAREHGVDPSTITYTRKTERKQVVVGYEGANRVWDEDQMAEFDPGTGISTTQGGGSCYVFYASSEQDQKRFLELLGAMKVVFVDSDGRQIGYASMDTENCYSLNGRTTVPLKLDGNTVINLGQDLDGNDLYGLMPLVKNQPTRVTALVYLDGNKLSNTMVLASGDIQGMLNIQFGSVLASSVTTVVESPSGTTTNTEYTHGDDNTAIEDEDLMSQYISVSANVTGSTSFDFDPDTPRTVPVNVSVEGIEPRSVTARFVRAVNSTQGSLMPAFTLTKNGEAWSGSYTFDRPGTYILRSVWVDGVEYPLKDQEPITIRIAGSAVSSLACSDISDGSRRVTLMESSSSHETALTLEFTSSRQDITSVRGIFLDEDGRQVTATFTQAENGTQWIGSAIFTSSGTYTMKYVEINGDQQEIPENLQPTLELLLGLKARTWISVSPETLAKLQAIYPEATATRFTLDPLGLNITGNPGDDVTLNIGVMVYDNDGNEIRGLSDLELVYGRVGSAVKKLDTNLTWNGTTGRYEGAFLVTEAGTYQFASVTAGDNRITAASNSPAIQALPPDDASYSCNHTPENQKAPGGDATVTLGIAYSSAASKIEALISGNGSSYTVEGTILGEDSDPSCGEAVTLWSFAVPSVNGAQDGKWTVEEIKLYGVYYNGRFYDEETGVAVNLADQGITTKVVQNFYVTLNGTSQEFTGYFMDDHIVDGMFVTITDFEGKSWGSVRNVKVNYYLEASSVTKEEFGYTADPSVLQDTVVSSRTERQASVDGDWPTGFDVTDLNFMTAGHYKRCEITFEFDGTTYNAGSGNTKLSYVTDGAPSDSCPTYTVRWIAPTVKFTGTNPAYDSTVENNLGSGTDPHTIEVHNYFEDFYVKAYEDYRGMFSGYYLSKATMQLTNAGSKIDANNSAEFTYSWGGGAYSNTWKFTSNGGSAESNVGAKNGNSRAQAGSITTSTINMKYRNKIYVLTLSNPIQVSNNVIYPRIEYVIPSAYAGKTTAPATQTCVNPVTGREDGRPFDITMPSCTPWSVTDVQEVSASVQVTYTMKVTSGTWKTSGCNGTSTDATKVELSSNYHAVGSFRDQITDYAVTAWNITNWHGGGVVKNGVRVGETRTISGTYIATAVVTATPRPVGDPYDDTVDDSGSVTEWYQKDTTTKIAQPDGTLQSGSNVQTYTWTEDENGNVISGTKPTGTHLTYFDNSKGNVPG